MLNTSSWTSLLDIFGDRLPDAAPIISDVIKGDKRYPLPFREATFKQVEDHELRFGLEKLFGGNFVMRDTSLKTATVWIDPQTRMIALQTPYSQFVVSAIKSTIRDGLRRWDKERKIWLIDRSCMTALEVMLTTLGFNIEDGTTSHEAAAAIVASNGKESPFHKLIAELPLSTLKKIYRLILMEHHPDKGGDHELMVRINQAWQDVEEAKK